MRRVRFDFDGPPRLTRREAVAALGGAALGVAATELASAVPGEAEWRGAYDGSHQAGVATPRQTHATLTAFDLHTPDGSDVARLLSDWTGLTPALAGASAGLTVTVGFGASLFDDRYGLRDRRPTRLPRRVLPGDAALDAAHGDGDLLLSVCADDRQAVFDAAHRLASAALGIARRRWTQHGFVSREPAGEAPRNVLGFRDGTASIAPSERRELNRHVWVQPGADADGMTAGTYLVYRRIRARLQAWDRSPSSLQELTVGRRKRSGAPLRGRGERSRLDGAPPRSHLSAMHPDRNGGVRLLRRSYNYDDGATADGEADAGIAFVCFAADPVAQVAPLLRRFDERHDDLARYMVTTAAGVFAVPPAPARGEYVGERLLG